MQEQASKKPFWARRKFLINERFQLHFVGFSGVLALAACLAFYMAIEYFFMKYHGFAIDVGMRPSDPFFRVLGNMETMMTTIFAIISVCVILVSIIGGILFSHRIAGPMYRMREHFKLIASNQTLEDVQFRKGDYFSDVAEAYNSQLSFLRRKLGVEPTHSPQDKKAG